MSHDTSGYGLWSLVFFNSAVFLIFAFSFFKPQTARDWRTFGGFAAFVVALFVEMYGFPLTIYLMSGWLQTKFPSLDLLSHDAGHLWSTLLGQDGNPHFGLLHIASYLFLGYGFYLLSAAWKVLYEAQRQGTLAVTGPYARLRHPQYVAAIPGLGRWLRRDAFRHNGRQCRIVLTGVPPFEVQDLAGPLEVTCLGFFCALLPAESTATRKCPAGSSDPVGNRTNSDEGCKYPSGRHAIS